MFLCGRPVFLAVGGGLIGLCSGRIRIRGRAELQAAMRAVWPCAVPAACIRVLCTEHCRMQCPLPAG